MATIYCWFYSNPEGEDILYAMIGYIRIPLKLLQGLSSTLQPWHESQSLSPC